MYAQFAIDIEHVETRQGGIRKSCEVCAIFRMFASKPTERLRQVDLKEPGESFLLFMTDFRLIVQRPVRTRESLCETIIFASYEKKYYYTLASNTKSNINFRINCFPILY